MALTYSFGTISEPLLLALHQIVAPEESQAANQEKLEAIVSSDGSGYAFAELDEANPVHIWLFFARSVIDIHAFNDGNKRTATALFKYIVTMSGGDWGTDIAALPALISKLYDIPTDEFHAFALGWSNYEPQSRK